MAFIIYPIFVVIGYPIFQLLYNMLFCTNKKEYYSDLRGCEYNSWNAIHSSIAIIILLLSSFLFLIIGSFFLKINPFEKSPISRPMRMNLIKGFILKFSLPLIFQIFPQGLKAISLWLVLILLAIYQIENVFTPISYKKDIINFFILLDSIEFWITLCACINYVR